MNMWKIEKKLNQIKKSKKLNTNYATYKKTLKNGINDDRKHCFYVFMVYFFHLKIIFGWGILTLHTNIILKMILKNDEKLKKARNHKNRHRNKKLEKEERWKKKRKEKRKENESRKTEGIFF